jgi:hypothetical protein
MNKDEIFEYLDNLRESGICNMYESGKFVREEFGLDRYEARDVVIEWMQTFSQRMKELNENSNLLGPTP